MKICNTQWLYTAICVMILMSQCGNEQSSVYQRIRDHLDQIKVVNTHEHQRLPENFGNSKFRLYNIVGASYLSSDIRSAGATVIGQEHIDSMKPDQIWSTLGPGLDFTRATSYYSHFVRGFRKLYNFNYLYFTKENLLKLSPVIENNYSDYPSWFDKAFAQSGYDIMFLDKFWDPLNPEVDTMHFALAFNIGELINQAARKPATDTKPESVYRLAGNAGFIVRNLDDYIGFCDSLIRLFISKGAVCLKNSQAYSRTLLYEEITYDEARSLYDKPSATLNPAETKELQDFMFHWIIRESIKYELPVQIHTGYLAGNGNNLENGQPLKLINLFLKYPEAKFDIFHGGFPWTDDVASLGKMFPNVYINLVWLAQISREKAVSGLEVMLDCVPYNKFFWGGDCGLIEESAGSLESAKDIVAEVLAARIARGLLTEDVALEIADRIFRKNAVEVFQLEKRLGKKFPG